MVLSLVKKIFGSRNDRLLRGYLTTVNQINALEAGLKNLSDDALKARTEEFRTRLQEGETLDQLLPEAFATVREASQRTLGMRHFDVQLAAGIALHQGKIAEMRTGEGKTLMATLPVYLNALVGKGVHVITVNDYLAQRDAKWMGEIYEFLGLSTGTNLSQMDTPEKQTAYTCDITYGTNNEFGFDYLRDNLEIEPAGRRQRGLNYAIIDEVDSILIDEARTPLIISGQAEDQTTLYYKMREVPSKLVRMEYEPRTDQPDPPGDFWVDEKSKQVHISEQGFARAEEILTELGMLLEGDSLYSPQNISLIHHLDSALRARHLFHKDKDYVVQNGEVVIVDEFTGRMLAGRRWSDGLHQAVEAKEGVEIQAENQTLASITFQNYFRLYGKLAGMTGTADTEAYEFQEIYRLETVIIPTHQPMVREDRQDQIYCTAEEKYNAIIKDIQDCHTRGQPVLVGTTSIENSEMLGARLEAMKLPHQVLNAKQHAREAEIIAQAGRPGIITIATNMAGRGTDIVLGGAIDKSIEIINEHERLNPEEKQERTTKLQAQWQELHNQVITAGGLHIIGTERHESRRIDNQLRGRSGRQGDPGSSRFYLSLEDSLLRIFAGDRIKALMERMNMPSGEPIEAGIVSRSIETAQRKVEARNFDIRKQLLEYDDVANEQRKIVYQQRNEMMDSENISDTITGLRRSVFEELVEFHVPNESIEEQWDLPSLQQALKDEWGLDVPLNEWLKTQADLNAEQIKRDVLNFADTAYETKTQKIPSEDWHRFERSVILQVIDHRWRDHLGALDQLRQGIHLRGYAQKNPKQEYKREAFDLFSQYLGIVKNEVTRTLMRIEIQSPEEIEIAETEARRAAEELSARIQMQHPNLQKEAELYLTGANHPLSNMDTGGLNTTAGKVDNGVSDSNSLYSDSEDTSPAHTTVRSLAPKIGRNQACPCGSGKKYKHCHGREA